MSDLKAKYEKNLKRAATNIIGAGPIPFPVSDTLLEILKFYLDEEDAYFIAKAYRTKKSLNMEQLVKKLKMDEKEIDRIASKIAKKGFIFNQPSSTGIMVYRLLPIEVTGAFEYTFMNKVPEGEEREKYMELAKLYDTLLEELKEKVQGSYESIVGLFKAQDAFDRAVAISTREDGDPIEIVIDEEIEEVTDKVLPANNVMDIIDKFDDIAVGNCFCRNFKSLIGHQCEINAPLEVCFTFGKSARHVINQGFARRVDKKEAREIMEKAAKAGLVHRTFHNRNNIFKEENSICNCCPDCCDGFDYWRRGALPILTSTNHLSLVDIETCTGCGTCESRCPVDAIEVGDEDKAIVDEEYCIGCGVCANLCPEEAISLKQTGYRKVFIPPPQLG
ncbi:4Fe-4S dicluster domain-containing protein [Candidatus Bathyarchaeota archaeon]|nr:4Fe-4S dicluster domain-containing protein [Candidatus Bathyarchaeota archaeon]